MTDELMALADRVEALTGPCRGIFYEAWEAVNGLAFGVAALDGERYRLFCRFQELVDAGGLLDAAMTLVPEGWSWEASSDGRASAIRHTESEIRWEEANAATPALALTAAALRALAAKEPEA